MQLEAFYDREPDELLADADLPAAHQALLVALESGEVRAASPDGSNGWTVHAWVKRAILLGFRAAPIERMDGPNGPFFDKTAYPPRRFECDSCPVAPPYGGVRSSRPAWWSCRRPTSTWARTSRKAR